MRDRAKLVHAHHVEHSLDDLLAEGLSEAGLLTERSTLRKHCEKGAQLLHGADAEDSGLADLSLRLIRVHFVATGTQNDDAVVAEVSEVVHDDVKGFLLAVTEKAVFLITAELVDDLSEEVHSVWLIHLVDVHVGHDVDHAAHHVRLRQDVEEAFVLREFAQDGARVERLVVIFRVLLGDAVDEGIDNHHALLLQHLLHADLVGVELRLGRFLFNVEVAVVRSVPLVLLLGLDLLFNQLDEERSQGVVVDVVEKTGENLAFLVEQKILQDQRLLLVQKLLHNLEEVAT